MDIFDNYPQGFWTVNNKKFIKKYDALLEAKESNSRLQFVYFDDVWSRFDRNLIGKHSLQDLYKKNAQRIRDKYDYLILYFSGGADSYNVLRTFLDNNIKIDEICVKWAGIALNSNVRVYTPNTQDIWCTNYISEWDYAIKPVLEEVAQSHPEIKIEIVDWTSRSNINLERAFNIVNHWHDIEVPTLAVWSPNEEKLVEQGKKVGAVYGIDKPVTYFKDNCVYMLFLDSVTTIATPNPVNIYGTELFYWTPEMPELAFEMANVASRWLADDPIRLDQMGYNPNRDKDIWDLDLAYQKQQKELRHVLYDNWTDRFQVLKSFTLDRVDKQQPLLLLPEFKRYKEEFYSLLNSSANQFDNSFLYRRNTSLAYRNCISKYHLLYRFDNE